jgi:hypothetical protein
VGDAAKTWTVAGAPPGSFALAALGQRVELQGMVRRPGTLLLAYLYQSIPYLVNLVH